MNIDHPFDPIERFDAKVLILGSFPSIASVQQQFYYAHPRNQFWPIMETLFNTKLPTNEARRIFALEHRIALWDVYASIERTANNSSDANLGNTSLNDIPGFLATHPLVDTILCTGQKAYKSLIKTFPNLPVTVRQMPSTSPAHAAMSFKEKCAAYALLCELVA